MLGTEPTRKTPHASFRDNGKLVVKRLDQMGVGEEPAGLDAVSITSDPDKEAFETKTIKLDARTRQQLSERVSVGLSDSKRLVGAAASVAMGGIVGRAFARALARLEPALIEQRKDAIGAADTLTFEIPKKNVRATREPEMWLGRETASKQPGAASEWLVAT